MNSSDYCHAFVTERDVIEAPYTVQFQMPKLTVTLAARDLAFASKAIRFIEETRGNPVFLDKHLSGGVYRRMPEKLIDVSSSFIGPRVAIEKDGEFDDRYLIRIEQLPSVSTVLCMGAPQLDAFLQALQEIADDYGDKPQGG